MKYAIRCIAIFIVLTTLLTVGAIYLLEIQMPLNGIIFFSASISLFATIIYGWIDAVYIKKRQPGL
ncbi:hypothetical protein [Fodinibius salsisoli]|uniref:Uncharacterized protein n=1 Tax=Fodinibius salsisoli TaxID=2820877 RepID=A0ABT3PMU7_9BACT|nr:hypothetical protein [Fodinibius salsisoli]MCW9707113.1 hypothetical protein [Fodinibius salsisoli]